MADTVFARCLSSLKGEREFASKRLKGPEPTPYTGDRAAFIEHVRQVAPRGIA